MEIPLTCALIGVAFFAGVGLGYLICDYFIVGSYTKLCQDMFDELYPKKENNAQKKI